MTRTEERRRAAGRRRVSERAWLLIGAVVFVAEIVIAVAVLGALLGG